MAKYGISTEGVEALNQLAQDLISINSSIESDGKSLKSTVTGLEDGLGTYGNDILELVAQINTVQEKGRESVEQLSTSIKKLANDVQELLNMGLG